MSACQSVCRPTQSKLSNIKPRKRNSCTTIKHQFLFDRISLLITQTLTSIFLDILYYLSIRRSELTYHKHSNEIQFHQCKYFKQTYFHFFLNMYM